MDEIRIVQVDERDSGWEDDRPRFRVYLHGSGAASTPGWTDTYDLTGVDLVQAIDWAQRQAGDTLTYAIALVDDDAAAEERNPGYGRGVVWLVGVDGNDDARDSVEAERHRRMLVRRAHPIGVPPADQMPPGVPDPSHDGMEPSHR